MKVTLCGRPLDRVWAIIEKTLFGVGFWLELRKNYKKTSFVVGLWLRLGQK